MAAYAAFGLANLVEEQPAAARDALRESATIARDRRVVRGLLPLVLAGLAEAHLALGEPTEAVTTAREGIDLGSAGGCLYNEALAQLALAGGLLATDCVVHRAEIESALERTEHLVASTEGRALSPRILELRGRLAAAVGDAPSSERTLGEALDLYRAIGAGARAERQAACRATITNPTLRLRSTRFAMKIAVIGGTGLIGSKTVPILRQGGHDVVSASPNTGVNTITGEGLKEAMVGTQVVIDLANSPSFEAKAVLEFFQTAGRNLLGAEPAAGGRHHVALSIVGADRTPEYGYFRA
jgi:hypothetical protein